MADYNTLNEMQYKAVFQTEGPVLILAGAGSGKTRVLTYRIAHMTGDLHIPAWQILAITFTNKAANEMRERAESLCGLSAGNMWISTFHSACLRILRYNAKEIGYQDGFTVYDPEDQKTVLRRIFKDLDIPDKQFTPKGVLAAISSSKDELITPARFAETSKGNFYLEKVAQIYKRYEETLKENNSMDFDDLIAKTVRLFEDRPDILERYQDKFRYIMVDEYQDTNNAQYRLIELLARKYKNICVVGDDDQSIYKFRGANIRNILDFEKDFPGAYVVRLEQNYRSTGNILKAANEVIRHNKARKEKALWTSEGDGEPVTVIFCDDDREEADTCCEEIKKLQAQGKSLKDVAFLYRTNGQSRAIEESLLKHNLPYHLFGGTPFYQRKEIKDLLSYLRFLTNDSDYIAAERIIATPPRGIGEVTREKLFTLARSEGNGVLTALCLHLDHPDLSRSAKKLELFGEQIQSWREASAEISIEELIDRIIEDTDYYDYLRKDDEMKLEDRTENIEEFKNRAAQYEEDNENPTLASFLEEIALVTSIDEYDENTDKLTLMTLHSAKGLEFPVVFITGFEDGTFPSYRAITSDNTDGEEDLAEERRLCYVGITRAKQKLYMTLARSRRVNGRYEDYRPSRFLGELPKEVLDVRKNHTSRLEYEDNPDYESPREINREKREHYREILAVPDNPYVKHSTEAVSQAPAEGFKEGDTVTHATFGIGTVVEAHWMNADWQVVVDFVKVGRKTLFNRFAKLTKV